MADGHFRIEVWARKQASGRYKSLLLLIDGEHEREREVPGDFAGAEAAEQAAYELAELMLTGESPHQRFDHH